MLINSINTTLEELNSLLNQLSNDDYVYQCTELSDATIGQHTRHIIELFQCLLNQYETGLINYDIRNRDYLIQTDVEAAKSAINSLKLNLDKPNKKLNLCQVIDSETMIIDSNYFRELLYNLEHCIHHQALIKVAVLKMTHLKINSDFGVARSTIEYRKQCVQ
ncbi:DinB family protein [Flavobacterium sp. SUN052]|uniref:DinB family protein n=1 Tax=Flavobacterium sp. SUN052 TaxID=3002441 RepID=UPI00237DDF3D|nr:DinB family protein [Flavobacterium sp. SUN052]MEC4004546.1 DinB family protein [Flavobacterium sp. SUN052]